MSTDAMAGESAEGRPAASPPPARSRRLPVWAWVEVLFWAAAISFVRSLDTLDGAIVNIITLIGGFLAVMPIFVWFCFFSGYGQRLRWGILYGALLTVGLLVGCLKVVSVSGELVPTFRWRWEAAPDEALAAAHPHEPPTAAKDQATGDEATGGTAAGAPESTAGQAAGAGPAEATTAVDLTTTTPDDFPQFLGPQRSCWIPGPKLNRDWTANQPRLLWKQPIGAGWSAFSVVNGFALTLEQRGPEEWVSCYDALSGKLRWVHAEMTRHETTLGGIGPRSTPTIHGGRVYTLGATGILNCLDGATGKPRWSHNLVEEYGLTPVTDLASVAWGRAASPLVFDDLVVVPAGGPAGGRQVSLVAFQKDTGDRVWEGGDDQIAYASPALATVSGVRQILSVNEKTVTGHDPETGRVFWSFPWPGSSSQNANNSQAVAVGDEQVFVSKGYMGGSVLAQVKCDAAGDWQLSPVWTDTRTMKTKFTNVVVHQGHVYGLSDGTLECIELATGKRRWKKGRYGHGQILGVGELLIVSSEAGDVSLVELTPEEYRELARMAAIEGKTWNNPALYGRYLLVRNGEQAACFELPVVE